MRSFPFSYKFMSWKIQKYPELMLYTMLAAKRAVKAKLLGIRGAIFQNQHIVWKHPPLIFSFHRPPIELFC